jgi:hypothetical protein
MANENYVEKLEKIEKSSILAIIDLFNEKGITELDVSSNDVYAYCFDDDCHCADNIKINTIKVENGYLSLIDDSGFEYSAIDFHIGTMPYIYNEVSLMLTNKEKKKTFDVQVHFHGSFNTTIQADSEDEARELAWAEYNKLDDEQFLNEIELTENGIDIIEI